MKVLKAIFNHEHPYWVGCIGPDTQIYGYLAKTHRFHYSHSLDDDYYWEQDLEWVEITSNEAVALINAGVGQLDGEKGWVADRLAASDRSLSVEEVLGEAAAHIRDEN